MVILAVGEALANEGDFIPGRTGVGTSSGVMTFGENYYRSLHGHLNDRRAASWIANYPPQKPIIDAQNALGLSAP